jgi:hypothetical protein
MSWFPITNATYIKQIVRALRKAENADFGEKTVNAEAFSVEETVGITQNVTIGETTLHFVGGILTAVN